MSIESHIQSILSNFDSVSLASITRLLETRVGKEVTQEATEKIICKLLMDDKLAGYQIDGEYVVNIKDEDIGSIQLSNILIKVASL